MKLVILHIAAWAVVALWVAMILAAMRIPP